MNDEQEATWFFGVVFFIIFVMTFGSCSESIEKAQRLKESAAQEENNRGSESEEKRTKNIDAYSQWVLGIHKLRKNGYFVRREDHVRPGNLPGSFCCEVFEPGQFTIKGNRVYLNVGETWHYDDVIKAASEL